MELKQLEYFLSVAESGSLSKASSVLGIVQPALSRQIRQLERDVGVQLFYRHGRGVRLTEEGSQFLAIVSPLVSELEQAKVDLRASAGTPAGDISFGMPPSISAVIGAPLVLEFHHRYPQVRLRIVDAFSGFVNEWLAAGRLDMAILNAARRTPYMRMDPLLKVDLFVLGRREQIEAFDVGPEVFPFKRLAEIPLIAPGRHHGLRRELDAAAQREGIELQVIVEIDALSALKELVRGGLGITVLPHGAILPELNDPSFAVRRLDPPVSQQMMLVYSLQRPTTNAMRALARAVRLEIQRALADGRMVGRVGTD